MVAVRKLVRAIDWCPVEVVERAKNLGLGPSIRSGVSEVLKRYEQVIVFEDDIDCVAGTYEYMLAALSHYAHDPRVMSVSGWTHPALRPPIPANECYFDGRFACWGWGTWRRAWVGMGVSAPWLLALCRVRGVRPERYGWDTIQMAHNERRKQLWAVRFSLLHFLRRGLALHPPRSLTNHVGFDDSTTSMVTDDCWRLASLDPCPTIPDKWPEPVEHPELASLWRKTHGEPESWAVTARKYWWRTNAFLRRVGVAGKRMKGRNALC